jgi:hypothetical protein
LCDGSESVAVKLVMAKIEEAVTGIIASKLMRYKEMWYGARFVIKVVKRNVKKQA